MPKQIVLINPFRCRLWDLHDRFEGSISEESCRGEIESFAKHGQIVPALGRPLRGDPEHDVELICGARRLFVARHLKKDLAVELREVSDREALILMDTENRQRRDISAYERGMSYARWLRSAHFQSQDDISRSLKISAAQVSRLLKLARLPAVVVNAFASPGDIHESWGLDLIEALDDAERRQPTIERARAISRQSRRLNGTEVYRQLLSASGKKGRAPKASAHDEVVKDESGRPLFRIRQLRSTIAVVLPVEHVPARTLAAIRTTLSDLLSTNVLANIAACTRPGSPRITLVQPSIHPTESGPL